MNQREQNDSEPLVDVRIAAVMNRVARHFSFRNGATMGNANNF
jgi:hypothetical protein